MLMQSLQPALELCHSRLTLAAILAFPSAEASAGSV
jgi:hypothetical protein